MGARHQKLNNVDVMTWFQLSSSFKKCACKFQDRRDARKYVTQMLKAGFIKHTVNKTTFSEQCYYTFCDDKFLAGSKYPF